MYFSVQVLLFVPLNWVYFYNKLHTIEIPLAETMKINLTKASPQNFAIILLIIKFTSMIQHYFLNIKIMNSGLYSSSTEYIKPKKNRFYEKRNYIYFAAI